MMRKMLAVLCMAAVTCPVFAEEVADVAIEPEVLAPIKQVAAPIEQIVAPEPESNPEIKFPHGMQVGLGMSATSGINGFVGYANKNFDSFWWKRLGLRLDFATTSPVKSAVNSAVDSAIGDNQEIGDDLAIASADLAARHAGVLIDFYPFGNTWFLGGWRLTGGYMLGKIGVGADLAGKISGAPGEPVSFELNGVDYRYLGNEITGRATVSWKYSGPYIGTGFDLGLFWGIKIYMDAGAVYTGKTAVLGLDVPINDLLQVSTDGGANWAPVENTPLEAQFEANKAAALSDANDELGKLNFFPFVKLGLMYRF